MKTDPHQCTMKHLPNSWQPEQGCSFLKRLRAMQHLRRIEGKESDDFCRTCGKQFPGLFNQHRRSQEHRRKERLTKRGCKLCSTGAFSQYPEYVQHIDSEAHKIRKDELQRVQRFLEDSDFDDVTRSPSLSDDVTSVEGHRQSGVECSDDLPSACSISTEGLEEADSESLKENFRSGALIASPGGQLQNSPTQSGKRRASWESEEEASCQWEAKARRLAPRQLDILKQPRHQLTNNVPEEALSDDGQEYISPTQAFFCQLCEQFFLTETGAKEKHCRTYQHQERYKAKIQSMVEKKAAMACSSSHAKSGLRTKGARAGQRTESCMQQTETSSPAGCSRSLSPVEDHSAVRMEIIFKNGALYLQPKASCREASTCSSGCNGNYFNRTDQSTDVPLLSSPIMS